MNRRSFVGLTSLAGAAALAGLSATDRARAQVGRDYYELRQYLVESQEQIDGLLSYMADAEIPALNRAGIGPVGVFLPHEGLGPVYVLRRHTSAESATTVTQSLLADEEFLAAAEAFLNAPAAAPAYSRVESSLLLAFTGHPEIETPVDAPGRVLQLRIYESPSVKTGQKKIEMFNEAEIAIFRKTGLNPVIFGEALVGAKLPNLTYMLAFETLEEKDAAWQRFMADPEWLELRARPEYADNEILCGITNIMLSAAACSQV